MMMIMIIIIIMIMMMIMIIMMIMIPLTVLPFASDNFLSIKSNFVAAFFSVLDNHASSDMKY
jgi:hypothetical protein